VQNLPTGAIEAAFLVSDTGEITRWILSFGSDCKVLAPEKLREEIAAEAHNVLDLYRTKSAYPT
jgi:predicted DNA-binding transcriptional regulator YafY